MKKDHQVRLNFHKQSYTGNNLVSLNPTHAVTENRKGNIPEKQKDEIKDREASLFTPQTAPYEGQQQQPVKNQYSLLPIKSAL